MENASQQQQQHQEHRIRKRAPNACTRCRQQKIRCSGTAPCGQCCKKNLPCNFSSEPQKVVVSKAFLDSLERQVQDSRQRGRGDPERNHVEPVPSTDEYYDSYLQANYDGHSHNPPNPANPSRPNDQSESESQSRRDSADSDELYTNPLVSGKSLYVADSKGEPSYLGTSSNWSFGRRILSHAHEHVYGTSLPAASLLFEGQTYELGRIGGRRSSADFDKAALPTSDFALFLINAVKFHCGQLFHLFDEEDFMRNFSRHHDQTRQDDCSDLWHSHYLLILALGKAFVVRVGQDRQPPGADLYTHAMQLLPDTTQLCKDPTPSMEILCCAALYLQCLDMRESALLLIGQALRMAVVHGIHTDIQSRHHSEAFTERCREVWWTVYLLDCHLSSLMGVPLALAEQDISAQLPSFGGASQKSLALSIHVKVVKSTTLILRTVYGQEGRMDGRFLASIKNALKCLASFNDERDNGFPLNLKKASSSISRLSAYLHLFHHQCIILTIRPLLYALWQKRVETSAQVRVSSTGSVRSLLRVCIASAHETLKILATLQTQSLLESFIPFDLESTWSSAVVLLVTRVVDPSLLRRNESWLQKTHVILDEMVSRGNLIAGLRKAELQQLEDTLTRLHTKATTAAGPVTTTTTTTTRDVVPPQQQRDVEEVSAWVETAQMDMEASLSQTHSEPLRDWDSEEGLSGAQLIAVADSLDFTNLDWVSAASMGQLDGCMY